MPLVTNNDCQAVTGAGIQESLVVNYMRVVWDWDGRSGAMCMEPPMEFVDCAPQLPMWHE